MNRLAVDVEATAVDAYAANVQRIIDLMRHHGCDDDVPLVDCISRLPAPVVEELKELVAMKKAYEEGWGLGAPASRAERRRRRRGRR